MSGVIAGRRRPLGMVLESCHRPRGRNGGLKIHGDAGGEGPGASGATRPS